MIVCTLTLFIVFSMLYIIAQLVTICISYAKLSSHLLVVRESKDLYHIQYQSILKHSGG